MAVGIETRYVCGDPERRAALQRVLDAAEAGGTPSTLNGIDFLEVLDRELEGTAIAGWRQRLLLVRCYSAAGLDALTVENVRIRGGARVTAIRTEWAVVLSDLDDAVTDPAAVERRDRVPAEVRAHLAAAYALDADLVAVGTDVEGDFSTYRLSLAAADPRQIFADFDPRLSEVEFSFKVECPSDFDCETVPAAAAAAPREPQIDYLAKDYGSFRQLMLDRLSHLAPEWRERNPADFGVAMVELLAHVADELSYFQDAVATEAYLGTARQRISVRRHARLVDYAIHEGTNARAWIALEVEPSSGADGAVLGAATFLTRSGSRPVLAAAEATAAVTGGAVAFETLLGTTLRAEHNEIRFHTWSDRACTLPAGSTAATLVGELPGLAQGGHLLLEEVVDPHSGAAASADPSRRHVVRITDIARGVDKVVEPGEPHVPVTEVRWHPDDALPFDLRLSAETDDGRYLEHVSVARGNLVLADHGRTLAGEVLEPVAADALYRPRLVQGPLTHAVPLPPGYLPAAEGEPPAEDIRPAAELFATDPRAAVPALELGDSSGTRWTLVRDLLASGPFAREAVAEIDNSGHARLRFGDGVHGLEPRAGTRFNTTYRVGNGPAGNVGAGAIAHLVDGPAGVSRVRNPLPAAGGEAPESLEEVRRYAPQAFRVQARAVTADDYARAAERHPEVERAAATLRWTGGWRTVFVSVDRRGGQPVDAAFEARLREHLAAFRLAGHDLEVSGPRFVPLDLELFVCLAPGYRRSDVARALAAELGGGELPGGRRGLFHPDSWTFGQTVRLSPVYAAASRVAGVSSVRVARFARRGQSSDEPLSSGRILVGRTEIARLDNDPNRPENGRLTLTFGGSA